MIEVTLRWFDIAALGVSVGLYTFSVLLTGAWLATNVQLRRERRQRQRDRELHGHDAVECWLETAECGRTNGWSSLAPEEGEAA